MLCVSSIYRIETPSLSTLTSAGRMFAFPVNLIFTDRHTHIKIYSDSYFDQVNAEMNLDKEKLLIHYLNYQ